MSFSNISHHVPWKIRDLVDPITLAEPPQNQVYIYIPIPCLDGLRNTHARRCFRLRLALIAVSLRPLDSGPHMRMLVPVSFSSLQRWVVQCGMASLDVSHEVLLLGSSAAFLSLSGYLALEVWTPMFEVVQGESSASWSHRFRWLSTSTSSAASQWSTSLATGRTKNFNNGNWLLPFNGTHDCTVYERNKDFVCAPNVLFFGVCGTFGVTFSVHRLEITVASCDVVLQPGTTRSVKVEAKLWSQTNCFSQE